MAKNQTTTKSESQSRGTFRHIFRVFKRRVSPARKPVASASNKILIEYNHSTNAKRPEPMKPDPVNSHQQNQGPKGVKFQGGGASNETFSHFIDHVKNKIKANSSFVADENGPKRAITRRDSFNDRVSHFINRAKLKIRTTTIVAGDVKLQPYTPR